MSKELKGLHRYKDDDTYPKQQIALKEIADLNGLTKHQIRAILVNRGIYINKPKNSTRVLKSHYVDQLVNNLEELNDTEIEYIERLTIPLLKKIIKAVTK